MLIILTQQNLGVYPFIATTVSILKITTILDKKTINVLNCIYLEVKKCSTHSIQCIYSIHFTSTCRNLWWLHSAAWSEHLVFIIADFPGVIPYSIGSTGSRDCRAIRTLIVLAAVTWVQLEPV